MAFNIFGKKEKQQETNTSEEDVLALQNILIGQPSVGKKEAIEMAGQLLVDGGYVMQGYIKAMKDREEVLTTYIGNGIAIPHGVGAARDQILKSGISVIQFPEGVVFGEGKVAYLVVGIAGKGNEHMKILTNLAEFIQDEEVVKELVAAKDREKIHQAFTKSL